MKIKTKKAYAIYGPNGDIIYRYIRNAKPYAIRAFMAAMEDLYENWAHAERAGYVCRAVEIVPKEAE